MNSTKDTYEGALQAVSAALCALCSEKDQVSKAILSAEEYNDYRATRAVGEQLGVTDALQLVQMMIADYRNTRAGAA